MGEGASFRGAAVQAVIDRSPKPDRLPARMLDLDGEVQVALVTLPITSGTASNPPKIEEYVITASHRFRISAAPRHLGHGYECPCIISPL